MALFSRLAVALLALSSTLALACSSTTTTETKAAPEPTPITDPSQIPAEALAADPAVDCPGTYAESAPAEGLNTNFSVAGQKREFVLLLPTDGSEGPRPLFVGFNGTSEDGESFTSRAKLAQFAARGFVVLAPSSNENGTIWPVWDSMRQDADLAQPNKDLDYFDQLVRCTAAHTQIDKNRIYVGGHSAGGIMTNYVLQRRSELLAGGIVGSGVFSLTSPKPADPLSSMMVLVTWGGDNDIYKGGTGTVKVPAFDFVEQASLASLFYDGQEKVSQANCRGANLGHAWLPINDWMIDLLLSRPKGISGPVDLAPSPTAKVECTTTPFKDTSTVTVTCPSSTTAGCQEACQLVADCGVENGTVSSVMAPQFTALGFSGTENVECGGCVSRCESKATTPADAQVLACIKAAPAACGPGIDGAKPLIDAINTCCSGRSDSPYCVDACTIIYASSAARTFFTTCAALAK
jgi:poly(3-hydroxybutyrate) depolymerase